MLTEEVPTAFRPQTRIACTDTDGTRAKLTYEAALEKNLRNNSNQGHPARAPLMKFASVSDASLLVCYESVRRQVAAATNMSGRYRLAGAHVRKYADALRDEMRRRRLSFTPIEWPQPPNFK
jgi:hypothetical protein